MMRRPSAVALMTLAVAATAFDAAAFAAQHGAPGESASARVELPAGGMFKECEDCPGMVVIAPGEFRMGAEGGEEGRPEGPVRTVRIARPFAVGRYEITTGQYAAFIEESDHPSSQGCNMWTPASRRATTIPEHDWRNPGYGRAPKEMEPVVCVSWNDAKAYTEWLTRKTGHRYRLPTEAEWEYVARAGSSSTFPWGEDPELACKHANVFDASAADPSKPWPHTRCSDGHPGVAPIAQFTPNAFGLYDVIGNVWEWLEDCYYAPFPPDAPTDGNAMQAPGGAACERRAVRGGSWQSTVMRNRPTFRGRDPATLVTWIFGFRVARDLP
jgi:formylglycine-generating enzyme required for sulfatase activity